MALEDVLREELENLTRIKENYEKELAELPKGSLQKKNIKGGEYFYVAYREEGKVNFDYKGKQVSEDVKEEYKLAKNKRKEYRHSISKLKKDIKFLKSALRGKE